MPGLNRHCLTASTAFSSRPEPRPRRTLILCAVPSVWMWIIRTTVPSMPARFACEVYCGAHLAITAGLRVRRSGWAWSARPAKTKPRATCLMNKSYTQWGFGQKHGITGKVDFAPGSRYLADERLSRAASTTALLISSIELISRIRSICVSRRLSIRKLPPSDANYRRHSLVVERLLWKMHAWRRPVPSRPPSTGGHPPDEVEARETDQGRAFAHPLGAPPVHP